LRVEADGRRAMTESHILGIILAVSVAVAAWYLWRSGK
jgi:hypothetical protein